MYLLLAGTSDTARAMIVDCFLGEHPDWKHLALEDINGESDPADVLGMQQTFMTMVACQCAEEARKEGAHVIITCPDLDMINGVQSEIKDPIITVHIGMAKGAQDFDHVIDAANKSVDDTCDMLSGIIKLTA